MGYFLVFYKDNKIVATHALPKATGVIASNTAADVAEDFTMSITGTDDIYTAYTPLIGGKDVLVRAVTFIPCLRNQDDVEVCWSRPSDPVWFRTIPYYAVTRDQHDVEKEDRAVYWLPPYKTTTTTDTSTISATLYWKKHVGPAVTKYVVYWWPAIRCTGESSSSGGTPAACTDAAASNLFLNLAQAAGSPTLQAAFAGTRTEGIVSARQSVDVTDSAILALDEPYTTVTTT